MSSNLELSMDDVPVEQSTLSTLPTELRQHIFRYAIEIDQAEPGELHYEIVPRKSIGLPDQGKFDGLFYRKSNTLVPIYTGKGWVYSKDMLEDRGLPNFFNLLLTDRRANLDVNYLMI